jgi:putative phage-type endonuclease
MIQGSQEWLLARVGKVTASRIHDIVATTKSGGFTAGRKNYLAELITERLTGTPAPSFQSAAMAYGSECEPEARAAYSFQMDVDVQEVGFTPHHSLADVGCSPDGFVGDDGLIEIKCPNTATHLDTLLHGKIDPEYITQMQAQMACTGRKWCDFVSYDKRLPEPMRLYVRRVPRDEKIIASLEKHTLEFLAELDASVALLRSKYQVAEAA